MEKESIMSDLAFIKCYFSFLPGAITRLEEAGLSLVDSLAIVNEVREKFNSVPLPRGKIFKEKLDQVLKKNSLFKTFEDVAKILAGKANCVPSGWTPEEIAELKFCPVTSVDVERSFSVYKHMFNSRRHSFTEENLEKIIVSNCFYARGE